mmetsp:Transcript_13499/g.23173  ORF Transcript_13499/g.23173 Transcript_13499/m.23173 type:complete len:85 (+) Transcript_13499:47-301(+)
MGKRKSSKKVITVKPLSRQPLPKVFDCPFCNHASSVESKLDLERKVGTVTCRICSENFQMPITYLTEPIDIYTEWLDECEKANS